MLLAECELIHVLYAFNKRKKETTKGRKEGRGLPNREGMLLG
jgi:hypothetical protein